MRDKTQNRLLIIGALIAGIGSASAVNIAANEQKAPDPESLFETSDKCHACHNGMTSSAGDDASIGTKWRSTIMSHSAKDPYWHAAVRREILEHPKAKEAIEDKCSTCHMPIARFVQKENNLKGEVLSNIENGMHRTDSRLSALSEDGVTCAVCHQIQSNNLGDKKSFDGGFTVDTKRPIEERIVFGPFDIADGTAEIMRSAAGFIPKQSKHMKESAFCATCHTLYTHALDKHGNEKAELAEQVPYLEWLHSDYVDTHSCQDCHMKTVEGTAPISSVLGKPREGVVEHLFKGGNFLLLRLLAKHRVEMGLSALPEELDANRKTTMAHLSSATANLSVDTSLGLLENGGLAFAVVVENLAGHKLPTAYPSRRVWLHVTVSDANGKRIFESGVLNDNGSIKGNDNDVDALRFEPHYAEITEPEQVQIYESIMGDLNGAVTTGLLSAASYLKDNRVLPSGFDKTTADKSVAVVGDAWTDGDFTAGQDRILYRVPLENAQGPFTVKAELWYQPIGYRWAMNLESVKGDEPRRFMRMYRSIPGRETAVQLTEVQAVLAQPEEPTIVTPPQ